MHEIVQEPPHQTIQVPATEHEKIVAEGAVKLERGVETFFRITEQRHMELASRAHEKASLLISINAIVISIVLSVLITKLDESQYLLLPTLLLIITASATIIFSILSTRPKLIKDSSKHNPIPGHEMNIIFFGDFANLSLDEYKKSMQVTYKNRASLYDSLSKDIYYQGIILVWKYKYINIAYNVLFTILHWVQYTVYNTAVYILPYSGGVIIGNLTYQYHIAHNIMFTIILLFNIGRNSLHTDRRTDGRQFNHFSVRMLSPDYL